jgi:YesN/AraC family two-component response regulator
VIRVLIADDHSVVRKGLKDILLRELEGAVYEGLNLTRNH